MIFSGALVEVVEAASGAEEGTSDDTFTMGTTLAFEDTVPLGESAVRVAGRDWLEFSIGETRLATEGRAIAGGSDRRMVFCNGAGGFSNTGLRLWRVESTKSRLSTTTLTPATCQASRTAAAR